MAAGENGDKTWLRIARFLSRGDARAIDSAEDGKVLLDGDDRGTISAPRTALEAMARAGLVERRSAGLSLSAAGRASLKRALAAVDPFQEQHREMDRVKMPDGGAVVVAANLAESPLAQLARRKAKDGKPFLTENEWRAGERLRSDYTRGQIMPRMGANWVASVASGRRDGGNGVADLTNAALASRQRVDRSIEAVGPELAGVLIDVCCFLKGPGAGGDGARLAGPVGKDRAEDGAWRVAPPLQSTGAAQRQCGADAALGRCRLSAEDRVTIILTRFGQQDAAPHPALRATFFP